MDVIVLATVAGARALRGQRSSCVLAHRRRLVVSLRDAV